MLKRMFSIAAIVACAAVGYAQTAECDTFHISTDGQSVGLVLSGGGAKGIAHIGFIEALEENEIPIDCISGTSMGAIVGSLYATGLTPAEMMGLIGSKEFMMWSSGQIGMKDDYRFVEPESSPQWIGLNLSPSSSMMDALPTRLINPLPMSFAFMELYAPSTGACDGDFNKLMVPYRCVASDVFDHRSVIFSRGELSESVRASMSFPLVFQPIKVNGKLLYDGGLYDVYPVNVMMEDFNPDRVIGVNVSSPNTKPQLNNLVGQLEDMIMNDPSYPFPDSIGVNVRFHIDQFGLLDWGQAKEIYGIGYKRGQQLADSIKERITARRPQAKVAAMRQAFNARKKTVEFDDVTFSGATPRHTQYMRYLFTRGQQGETMSLDQARSGFYRLASTGRMRNLVPHAIYNDTTGLYHLALDADVDKDFKLSVGGYLTTSSGSMIYASAKYDPFALYIPSAIVEGWLGQNYLAASAKMYVNLPTSTPSRLVLRATALRKRWFEDEKMFYDFSASSFLASSEVYVKGGWEVATGQHGILRLQGGYGHLTDSYRVSPTDVGEIGEKNSFVQNVGLLQAHWSLNTLNDPAIPNAGSKVEALATATAGSRKLSPDGESHGGVWGDFNLSALRYFPITKNFSLGTGIDAFYSARPLLNDYTAAIATAPAFTPLASSCFLYDPMARANSWVAASLHPVLSIGQTVQLRADCYLLDPMRRIECADDGAARYDKWFSDPRFLGELSVAFRLPNGAIRAYVDYRDSSAQRWSAGIAIGLQIHAPEFMR